MGMFILEIFLLPEKLALLVLLVLEKKIFVNLALFGRKKLQHWSFEFPCLKR